MRVQTAISAKVKNNKSLLQYANAVARHKRASVDLGSSDQSNIKDLSIVAEKVSEFLPKGKFMVSES